MKGVRKMRKIGLFLLVMMFSVRSEAVCPAWPSGTSKPKCQVAEGKFKNGEVSYKASYCRGEFPYCEADYGDCCSDPSYALGGGCCDPREYVSHKVATITPGGVKFNVGAYKCCSIAEYGRNSTYYFDKEEHVHCCGGEVYHAKSTEEEKSCCSPEFDSEGNITHYHTVVSVLGAPEGETNQVCCKAIGDAPGVYRATAYWSGSSALCCEGTAYKTGTDDAGNGTYGCCHGTKAPKEERTHGVVSVLGAPNEEEACCGYYEEESGTEKKLGTAYWNGSSVQCCNGIAYQPKGAQVAEYDCCIQETVPSVIQGVPETEEIKQICCKEGEVAYWDGEKAGCCDGELGGRYDNQGYICCPVIDSCPDGETKMDDYKELGVCKTCCPSGMEGAVDGECCGKSYENWEWWGGQRVSWICHEELVDNYVGDKIIGKACCSKCDDREEIGYVGDPCEIYFYEKNYKLVGAIKGACCGGYTDTYGYEKCTAKNTSTSTYKIRKNGPYYCAVEYTSNLDNYEIEFDPRWETKGFFTSDRTYCEKHLACGGSICYTVPEGMGDPRMGDPNGEICHTSGEDECLFLRDGCADGNDETVLMRDD